MANTRINYKWAKNYNEAEHNNGFSDETFHIVTDGCYDFNDFLDDSSVIYEKENDVYFVLDENFERTGNAYMIISTEETNEEI